MRIRSCAGEVPAQRSVISTEAIVIDSNFFIVAERTPGSGRGRGDHIAAIAGTSMFALAGFLPAL
jgi:hypothetical protein